MKRFSIMFSKHIILLHFYIKKVYIKIYKQNTLLASSSWDCNNSNINIDDHIVETHKHLSSLKNFFYFNNRTGALMESVIYYVLTIMSFKRRTYFFNSQSHRFDELNLNEFLQEGFLIDVATQYFDLQHVAFLKYPFLPETFFHHSFKLAENYVFS